MSAIELIKTAPKTAIKVKSVKIEKLFEIFDYDIEYANGENVLIITGPNGFGKTQVLNILYNLFNREFFFFHKLVFNEITVSLSEDYSIKIEKTANKKGETVTLLFSFWEGKKKIENFDHLSVLNQNLVEYIENLFSIQQIEPNKWIDFRINTHYTNYEVIDKYGAQLPTNFRENIVITTNDKVNKILDSINVHLIREQRLFKKINSEQRTYRLLPTEDKDQTIMTESIKVYSDELSQMLSEYAQKSYAISQDLDSSYPNRLISEKNKISKEEYDKRFADLKEKQGKLTKNGFYESKQQTLEYSKSDAKALLVYLNDLDKKLSVFDDLLEKLELFTNILNERRFTFKSIKISKEKGFYFETSKGKELKLNELSSGEQHEVVLLYELIFNTNPSTLVLIDEPEISLHVTWQKEFLNDLLNIIKMQNFQVMVATHSPSIINDRWDLVYNMGEKVEF